MILNRIRQILAIARTEFRFGYRRPGPALLALIGCLSVAGGTIFSYSQALPKKRECLEIVSAAFSDPDRVATAVASGNTIPPAEQVCQQIISEAYADAGREVAQGVQESWFSFLLFSLVFVAAASSPAIAADRQFGACEWLCALPIDGNNYLLGKILGMFLSALAGALIPLFIFVPITLVWMHTLPVGLMLALALLDGLPALLWSVSFGVLTGVIFRNRMKAAMTGVVLGLFSLIAWLYTFTTPLGRGSTTDTASYFVFQQFGLERSIAETVSTGQVVRMYLVLLATAALLWIAARGWLQQKENF